MKRIFCLVFIVGIIAPVMLIGADIENMALDQATDVVAEINGDGTIEIEWYPLDKSMNFTLLIRNEGTGVESEIEVGSVTEYTASGYDINSSYTVIVIHDNYRTIEEDMIYSSAQVGESRQPVRAPLLTLNQEITKLDLTQFPRNVLTSQVMDTDDNTFIAGLGDISFWEVRENGALMTDCLEVDDSTFAFVDMVFIIDYSGSMQGEINAVKNNVRAFVDSLDARGWNYRLGFVRFGSLEDTNQMPVVFNDGNLTDDVSMFSSWLDDADAWGGTERGLQAVIDACNEINFRPGSQRHFLLITDEDSDGGDLTTACNCCNSKDISTHVAVNNSGITDYVNGIAACTGGRVFSVIGPYDDILDDIQDLITGVYFITYCSPNTDCDGLERTVELTAYYGGQSSTDTRTYIPCACPVVELTPETAALNDSTISSTSLTLSVHVTDSYTPFVSWVHLFYRQTGESNYTEVAMSLSSGTNEDGIWSYTVTGLQDPGLDYYIVASDTECRVTGPSTDPSLNPYQIAVEPNYLPDIVHTPVQKTCYLDGVDIDIEWEASDNSDELVSTCMYYRRYGTLQWVENCISQPIPSPVSMVIPASVMTEEGVEYYIRATDNFGTSAYNGTPDNPNYIENVCPVCVPELIAPAEAAVMDNGCLDGSNPEIWDFDWTDCEDADYYHLYVHHTGSANPVLNDSTITESFYHHVSYGYIVEGNRYDWIWRVRAMVGGTWGEWSPERSFDVEPLGTDCDTCIAEQPMLALVGYSTVDYTNPIWEVQVEVMNNGPGEVRDVSVTMNSDVAWLTIPDPNCSYGDISDGASAMGGSDTYTFDLTGHPGGSFNVWFDVVYSDTCGTQYQVRLDPEFEPEKGEVDVPITTYRLAQNYPNPFNPSTTISYQIPKAGHVELCIYDVSGRLVRRLVNAYKSEGLHTADWNGKDSSGRSVSSGIYFYRMKSGDFIETRRMVLLR